MSDEQPKKPRGDLQHRFQKGKPPGPGRPKGSIDKNTLAIRNFCQSLMGGLFKDPKYKAALRDRIMRGKEHPAVMQAILAYGYGKPKEHLVVENPDGSALEGASRREELLERLCTRLAPVVIAGPAQESVEASDNGGARGTILDVEAIRETEPESPAG
jgi:hypothetical protein